MPAVASTATMAGVGSALTRGPPIHQVAVIVAGYWIRPLPWPERPPRNGSKVPTGAGRRKGHWAVRRSLRRAHMTMGDGVGSAMSKVEATGGTGFASGPVQPGAARPGLMLGLATAGFAVNFWA